MQLNGNQIVVALTLIAISLGSTCFAQQEDKALLKECFKAHAEEFQPLAKERDGLYQKHSNYVLSISNILRWLEQDPKTANAKRLKEIAGLEARLQALKDQANLTSDQNAKDVAATVATANAILKKLKDQHNVKIKPLTTKFATLQRKYKAAETRLKPVMLKLFREQGNSETTEKLTRSYGSFSYSTGATSGSYKREGQNKSAAICYIYLINEKVGQEKYGLFAEKYPVAYRSKNQLEVLVDKVRVTIYSSEPELNDKQLDTTLANLVDFEALEAMLAP